MIQFIQRDQRRDVKSNFFLVFVRTQQYIFLMDEEEKYWSNLEQIYVHNVYEQISTKYDELLNLSQKFQEQNSMGEECVDKVSKRAENEIIKSSKSKADSLREVYRSSKTSKNNERTLSNQFSFGKNEIRHICNLWPKVKKFIQKIEPYSLIGTIYSI